MSNKNSTETSSFFKYKGFPLVRNKNTIYFGNMSDEFVVMIQILSTEKVGDLEVASKVRLFRMLTDESLPANERITKTADKSSLYEALDIASAWLERSAG
jgi:mannitol/fructose-specific phosphotransferase system IIA component (Ntr-type)